MLLVEVELRNFRAFRGVHKVSLLPSQPNRPVILIGGENGAGKTSLLEATLLALFGRRSAGPRVTADDYNKFLMDRMTRPRPGEAPLRRSGVAVEFVHGQNGVRSTYRVDRGWERHGHRVSEDLLVLRDGLPLFELDRDHWQDFVHDLIPPALAGLFFFDGERIQALADDVDGTEFAGAVRSLLGIDTVRQLRTDLDTYLSRGHGPRSANRPNDHADNDPDRLAELQSEVVGSIEELGTVQSRLDAARRQVGIARDRFVKEGGEFARKRGDAVAKEAQLEREIRVAEEGLRELVGGLLPFALAPELVQRVLSAIEADADADLADARAEGRADAWKQVSTLLGDARFWHGPALAQFGADAREALIVALGNAVDGSTGNDSPAADGSIRDARRVHHLAAPDRDRVRQLLGRAVVEAADRARAFQRKLEQSERELNATRAEIRSVPSEEALLPLETALSQAMELVQRLEAQATALRERREDLERRIEAETREQARRAELVRAREDSEDKRVLAARSLLALAAFESKLVERRIAQLESAIAGCFNRLSRKQELIARARLDPSTLQPTLWDPHEREVVRDLLSAGEKQIFAVSLLWALAEVSGRRLPMIIDTPLGRLDRQHRSKLVRHYFPFAAEQVVVLSTDTEIDRSWARELRHAISRSYRIVHDERSDSAVIQPGYFWEIDASDDGTTASGEAHLEHGHRGEARPVEPAAAD